MVRTMRYGWTAAAVCWCTGVAGASDRVISIEAVVKEQQIVGYTVGPLTQSRSIRAITALAGNSQGGFAAVIETRAGGLSEPGEPEGLLPGPGPRWISHVFGSATLAAPEMLLDEATISDVAQAWYGPMVTINDSGNVAVTARVLGAPFGFKSSAWQGTVLRALQGEAAPSNSGYYWRYAAKPHLSSGGDLFWQGGLADDDVHGSPTVLSGFFSGASAAPVLLGGTAVSGLPANLAAIDAVGPASALSSSGNHYLILARMDVSLLSDEVLVKDGVGLQAGGSLIRESTAVAATGALSGETWAHFDHLGVNTSGQWAAAARTSVASTPYSLLVKDGDIVYRSSNAIGDHVLGDTLLGLAINNDGDVVHAWRLNGLAGEALFLNDLPIMQRGDIVDFNGDGSVDDNYVVSEFSRLGAVTIADRTAGILPSVFVHVIATLTNTDTNDEIEAVLRLDVRPTGPTCAAIDYDEDGFVSADDFDAFLDLFNVSDLGADLDGDELVDINDFLIFVELFSMCA
ncbi:MAG: hypothetical protein KF912_02670 [Phycisphaeraceae bacterium]|nr:hypothetical protein [Phycisphaeraceae bacterium]MBX3366203.1 hypothetical protein [Phycisphaeraceae bacterium]